MVNVYQLANEIQTRSRISPWTANRRNYFLLDRGSICGGQRFRFVHLAV